MSLEDNLKKLEVITEKLENPSLSMDEGVKLYEEGMLLAKDCYKSLNEIKGKVTIIKQDIEAYREETFE